MEAVATNNQSPSTLLKAYSLLALSLLMVSALWFHSRDFQTRWNNVPPPPSSQNISTAGMGDTQLSYRLYALMIQSMGDTGGRIIGFDKYNYDNLTRWLDRISALDNRSSLLPFLASYYFSNVKDPDKLRALIGFLAKAGQKPTPPNSAQQNWRWLGQAITLARFNLKDQELALDLAYKLANLDEPNMPGWTKQMPAFILNNKGDKEGAYQIMLKILQSSAETLPPEELFFTRDYICTRLQTPEQARLNPLCQEAKKQ